ncbi:MAG: VanZ family protein [Phycisphaerales bacterium]|nr:MAG: VanZ family protein [Phycisphaerales bacterium]
MALSRRHKLTLMTLVLYWPALFVAAHIPIPRVVREAGVSDKSLHFFAYMVLVFLLWFAVCPDKRVNWRKAAVWWVLLVVVWYGAIDEWLQGYVAGRSTDIVDFFADLAGAVTSLVVLSILSFWPASLLITSVLIFGVTNVTRANLADVFPVAYRAFNLFAYALLTMLWIQYGRQRSRGVSSRKGTPAAFPTGTAARFRWVAATLLPPMGFLVAAKLGSLLFRKVVAIGDVLVPALGIVVVVVTVLVIDVLRRRLAGSGGAQPFDT